MNTEDHSDELRDRARTIIEDHARATQANAHFESLLRGRDEFTQKIAWLLAHEADPGTELEAVVELAASVAAYWRTNHGEPADPDFAAAELVIELRKIWQGEQTSLKSLRARTASYRPKRDSKATKKTRNPTKAKAKRKAARKARKRK